MQSGIDEPTAGIELNAAQQKTLEEARLKDLKAKNYLFSSINRTILKTITQKDTSKQLWDSMRVKYQGNARVQRSYLQGLRITFETLEMRGGESVTDYFGKVIVVANDMRNCGEDMPDVKIVEKILRTLTDKFNYIVCSIEESKDIKELTVDALQSSLLVHEQKFKKGVDEEQALRVTAAPSQGSRGRGQYPRGRGRGRGFNKAEIECYKCHRFGHFKYECPTWEKRANYAEQEGEEEMLLMAFTDLKQQQKDEVWFLDSGCSNHMTGNKGLFTSLDGEYRHSVKLGNGSKLEVLGKGNIFMSICGTSLTLQEVFYVPELSNNLLSVGQSQEKGLTLMIHKDKCEIFHKGRGLIFQT